MIRQGVSVLKRDGVLSFIVKAAKYIYNKMKAKASKRYSKWAGVRTISVDPYEVKVYTDNASCIGAFRNFQSNEKIVAETILRHINPTDVFFDVGANVGIYSCLAAEAIDSGEVVSFEPYPPNIRELKRNLNLNESRAVIKKIALGDDSGEVGFTPPTESQGAYGGAAVIQHSQPEYTVQQSTVDHLVSEAEIPTPDILKIDVEGAEMDVLQGMSNTLSEDRCGLIVCEVHQPMEQRSSIEDFNGSKEDVIRFLESNGYSVSTIQTHRRRTHIMAQPRSTGGKGS